MEFDRNRRKLCIGLGATVLALASTIPSIAHGEDIMIVSETRPDLVEQYNKLMDSWHNIMLYENGIRKGQKIELYKQVQRGLGYIIQKVENERGGRDNFVGEDPREDIKFTPHLAAAVSLIYKAYEEIDLERLADGEEEQIQNALELRKTGSGWVNASWKYVNRLVDAGKYEKEDKPGIISLAFSGSDDYWDVFYRVRFAKSQSKESKLRSDVVRKLVSLYGFPDRDKHFPLDILYKQ